MPAIFPGSVRVFTTKVDLVDTVLASHVNLLQDEVTAVQTTLGTSLLSSTWAGTYTNTTSHVNLSTRLSNIEAGVKEASTNLAAVSGSVVGTTGSQTLTGKTISGSNNTLTNIAQSSITNLGADLALKAPISSPTFTGTVNLPADTSVGTLTPTEIGYVKGVSSAIQTQLNNKANSVAPTFTGVVSLPSTTSIGNVSATEIGYVDGVTSSVQTQLNTLSSSVDTKAPTAGPTFTGTVVLPAATSIGNVSAVELGYVDGVTSSIQTQLNLRAALASPTFTGTVILPATTSIGSVTSTQIGFVTGVTSSIQTQLNAKAPIASPTFTGTTTVVSPTATGSTGARQITISTADPSGGADGDLWIKYV